MIDVIAYCVETLAPHQNMMVHHLKEKYGDRVRLTVRRIDGGTGARRRAALRLMARVVADALMRPDAVIYFASFASAPFTLPAVVLGHRRWIYHSQDWIQEQRCLAAWLERLAVRHAPVVLWNEDNRAGEARRRAGRAGDILVVPTYLPRDFEAPAPSPAVRRDIAARAGVDPGAMVAIFAGGSYARSRLSMQLVAAMVQQDEACVLVFSGPARVPEDIEDGRIVDLGLLSHDDMLAAMSSCDIGMLLYDHAASFGHRYQQPGRLTEYLRCGLRLVATPFPDAERLAREGDCCILVDGYDVDELAAALQVSARRVRETPEARFSIKQYCEATMIYEPAADAALAAVTQRFNLA